MLKSRRVIGFGSLSSVGQVLAYAVIGIVLRKLGLDLRRQGKEALTHVGGVGANIWGTKAAGRR